MTADSTAVQVQLDATGRIAQDVHCIHCGYNLRSLLPGQACPECDQPVGESLRGDLLQFSNPAWLARLASGMGWIVVACILSMVLFWSMNILVRLWIGATNPSLFQAIFWVTTSAIGLARTVGIWKVTLPEPRLLDARQGPDARAIARVLLVGAFALTWTTAPLTAIPRLQSALLGLAYIAMHAVGWVMLYVYLARLARRVPASGLVRLTWAACVMETLLSCYSLFVRIVTIWAMWTTGTATSLLRSLPWLNLIYLPVLIGSSLLPLTMAAIYRRRFRRVLRQSQETTQGARRAGETLA